MTQALRCFKESTEQQVLAQVWAPIKSGDRYVLTTSGQPFVLDPHSNGLHQYRMVSSMYMFSVDGESDGDLGLPGRVFQKKLPEWTPNVQYYSRKEYPRLNHALHYNVQGSLALPVFEPSGLSCIGVLELIMTSQKINYAPDVDKICKALEAVNLKSSEILDHSNIQICNDGHQCALAEILEILTMVCESHKLPLAQTWVPCRHRSVLADGGGLKKSCTSFDGSCMDQICMSTTDLAFYLVDAHMWGFREACAEHHLQKGQGVAGKAFSSHGFCFCSNITQFSKTEYPLVHYARMFRLTSCFAICLRSTHTGNDDYILEFFLPPSITNANEQRTLLNTLLATMKRHFCTLKIASGEELDEAGSIEDIRSSMDEKHDPALESIRISRTSKSPPEPEAFPDEGEMVQVPSLDSKLMVELDAVKDRWNDVSVGSNCKAPPLPENEDTRKALDRKRGKAEKSISLEVLQKYFAGSLKDAAKSLGVCPTTMKRICRRHGISRWPSRKINKVNRSLSKLKRVIESVQGAEGAFSLNTLSRSPIPGAVGSISRSAGLNGSTQMDSPSQNLLEFERGDNEPYTCKTPGRDGQVGKVIPGQGGFPPEFGDGSNRSKTRSGSTEESTGLPMSHGSCHGSLANETAPANDLFVSSAPEQCIEVAGSLELAFQQPELNVSAVRSIPDAVITTELQEPLRGMLIEDAGSSQDLRNLCASTDAPLDEQVLESIWTNPLCSNIASKQLDGSTPTAPHTAGQEVKMVTIKAIYGEDIIRFRISSTSGILELKEEVAKRLKLEVGTFDIRYLDDDHEWVLIACDSDLQECMDTSQSSGKSIIRLRVHDVMANLGSSYESSGELQ
ncbi:protein NLP7 isoform X2 [Malania oleifera]|nr:protein NLP7 isoform X2 [Malania oleifera]XP_057969148.1 protein NLP7 isoform X2 [Malania oleifera]